MGGGGGRLIEDLRYHIHVTSMAGGIRVWECFCFSGLC